MLKQINNRLRSKLTSEKEMIQKMKIIEYIWSIIKG